VLALVFVSFHLVEQIRRKLVIEFKVRRYKRNLPANQNQSEHSTAYGKQGFNTPTAMGMRPGTAGSNVQPTSSRFGNNNSAKFNIDFQAPGTAQMMGSNASYNEPADSSRIHRWSRHQY
jgi:hypothetical protein